MSEEIRELISQFGAQQRELIHILHWIQGELGYIPPEAIFQISRQLRISESEIFGILTFYKSFTLQPRGKHLLTVCTGTACHVRGAPAIVDELKRKLKLKSPGTTEDKMFTLETVNCLGACALGPIVVVDGEYHGQVELNKINKIFEKLETKEESTAEK